MTQSSSGGNRGSHRRRSGGGNRGKGSSRSGGGGRSHSPGGSRTERVPRKPEPKPTFWQKFIKAITFGAVDPLAKKKAKKPAPQKREKRAPSPVEPTSARLYVGNLDYSVDDADLEVFFSAVGTVRSASVVRQGRSDKSKGFAFVEMGSIEEAAAAVSKLNDVDLKGRKVLVTGAKTEKPERVKREEQGEPRSERSKPARERSEPRSATRGGRERRERGGRSRGGDDPEGSGRRVKAVTIETVTSPALIVSGINAEATDEDFADIFAGIGSVQSCVPVAGKENAVTRDFRISLSDTAEAQKAVEFLHGKTFMGHRLKVTGDPEGPADPASVRTDTAPALSESAAEDTHPSESPTQGEGFSSEPEVKDAEASSDLEKPADQPAEEAPAGVEGSAEEGAPFPSETPEEAPPSPSPEPRAE